MITSLLALLLVGLVIGGIARLFVRSPARLGCLGTSLLGIIGSYAGGTIGAVLFHGRFDIHRAATLLGAIAGTIVLLTLWRAVAGNRAGRR